MRVLMKKYKKPDIKILKEKQNCRHFLKLNWLQKPLLETNFHLFKSGAAGAVRFLMSITLPLLSGEPSGFSLACIICVLLINMIRACSLLRLLLSACKSRELYFITFRVHKIIFKLGNHSLLVLCSKLTDGMKISNLQSQFHFLDSFMLMLKKG